MTRSLLLLLLLLRVAACSTSCAWTKVTSTHEQHISFLVQSEPPRLFHGVWSQERALLSCSWTDEPDVTRDYASLCQRRAQPFTDSLDERFELDERKCARVAKSNIRRLPRNVGGRGDEGSEVRVRVKRGFIVPGTLWCGSGNKAPSFDDLGVFSGTDNCCREHDQCKDTILSFQSQFGVFNSNIFTMSHCDCDNKFRNCLREANDSISDVVGYTFFNLLKMQCFTFSHQLQCMQRNWFGMCKESQMALYADVHPPILYESNQPTETCTNSSCSTSSSDLPKSNTTSSTTTSYPKISTSELPKKPKTESPNTKNDLENALPARHPIVVEQYIKDNETCDVFKELDECGKKIRSQQRKFGLYNEDWRTIYDCNCTHRFLQTLPSQPNQVQKFLLGRVSTSCLRLKDCTNNDRCDAALVASEIPAMQQRPQTVSKFNYRRLSKLCVRMMQRSQIKGLSNLKEF